MRLRGYPETSLRAAQALKAATKIPRTPVLQHAKHQLLALQYNWSRGYFNTRKDSIAVCWNGLNGTRRVFMDAARDAGARRLFFELAPLPGRLTIDPCGVNFANSLPRTVENYKRWCASTNVDTTSWRRVTAHITQRTPVRPATGTRVGNSKSLLSNPFLFAPLQVPGDSQLRLFGGNFRTIESFVRALHEASHHLPKGWHVRIKEHPTAPVRIAESIIDSKNPKIVVDNVTDTFEQVRASRGIVTVNSSVGLEAMFFDKPVIATGMCFWAIDGVAVRATSARDLISYFRIPETIQFDVVSRDAFLTYLTMKYFPFSPKKPQPEIVSKLIRERLSGTDQFGFWSCA